MGAYTAKDSVWYPDQTDIGQPNSYLATMAQSISDGLGARMGKQEITQSMVANIPSNQSFVTGTGQVAAFSINSAIGFNNGMSLSNGIITINQAGLYIFAVNCLGAAGSAAGFIQTKLRKNGGVFSSSITNFTYNGSSYVATTSNTGVMQCAVNDQIDVFVTFNATTGSVLLSSGGSAGSANYNILSAALLKAS